MISTTHHEFLAPCCQIAQSAGELIMTYFSGNYLTKHKEDRSPVTDADVAANLHITKALADLTPHIPVIAEEDETLSSGGHALFWLVDPLDGTRSFVRGETEFTVNIGLIENARPVLGVIYAPPHRTLYYGHIGHGAFMQQGSEAPVKIMTRTPPKEGLTAVRSQSHASQSTLDYMKRLNIKEAISASSSIKFCVVAEGKADLYPRFGRTMEWDTAAGHAILQAAGGRVETVDGKEFLYGKPGFENPGFIAYGK